MAKEKESRPFWFKRFKEKFLSRELRDRKQFASLLHTAQKRHLFNQDALTMMEGVLKVSDMKARNIMVARAQMVVLEHDATPKSALPLIIESNHSRFPVIDENRDKVLGILLAKDLLQYIAADRFTETPLCNIMRPPVFIPESKRLDILLKDFRLKRNHMAIVIDEYGSVSGLVTIEDVLEQIVGSIEDETDSIAPALRIQKMNPHEYHVNALVSIARFNEYFNTQLSDIEFDTIGGYVMQKFGRLPKPGESITMDSFQVTVVLASKRRLQLLRFTRLKNKNE